MKLYKKFIKIYAEHNKLNMKQFFYRNENLIEGMKSILKFLTFFSIFDKISLKFFLAKNIYKCLYMQFFSVYEIFILRN